MLNFTKYSGVWKLVYLNKSTYQSICFIIDRSIDMYHIILHHQVYTVVFECDFLLPFKTKNRSIYIYIENRKHNIKYIFQQGNNKTIITMASTTKISLEEHFRQVADVKELLSLAGLPMRATAVDALLQLAAQGVSAEGLLEALNYLKDKKIATTLGSEYS